MTKKELNRDIRRLWIRHQELVTRVFQGDYDQEWDEIKKELRRLYYADREGVNFNVKSLKILMAVNRNVQLIPYHQFGITFKI